MSMFDYEKAAESLKGDQFGLAWLQANRQRLEEMTPALLDEILALIQGGQMREAWEKYYGGGWAAIAEGAAADVTNTADMATRAAKVREMLVSASTFAVKALLAAVAAGFCL